jgi:hypothetical protein
MLSNCMLRFIKVAGSSSYENRSEIAAPFKVVEVMLQAILQHHSLPINLPFHIMVTDKLSR